MVDWQTPVAIILTIIAAIALLGRIRNWMRGASMGGCGSCPSKSELSPTLRQKPLVQIGTTLPCGEGGERTGAHRG